MLDIKTISETIAGTVKSLDTFGHDAIDRLTSAAYPAGLGLPGAESFGYDSCPGTSFLAR